MFVQHVDYGRLLGGGTCRHLSSNPLTPFPHFWSQVPLADLKAANSIKGDLCTAGSTLLIPGRARAHRGPRRMRMKNSCTLERTDGPCEERTMTKHIAMRDSPLMCKSEKNGEIRV